MIETLCYEAMLLSVEFVYCQRRSYTLYTSTKSTAQLRIYSESTTPTTRITLMYEYWVNSGNLPVEQQLFLQQLSRRMSICGSSPSTSLCESCCPMRKQNRMCRNMHAFSTSDKKLCGIFFLSDVNYCNELDYCNSQERRYSVESV